MQFFQFTSFVPLLRMKAPNMGRIFQSSSVPLGTLFVLSCVLHVSSATTICYYPNGGIAPTYQPCNGTSEGSPSACCELSSSACSLTGYCYGNAGVMYRGGCTDSTFNAVECPQKCKDVNTGAFSNINLCPGSNGNGFFTCSGSGEFTIDMCQTNFTFNAGTLFTPSSAAASQGTATVTTTATATPSASSTNSGTALTSATTQASCSETALTVGLAVGLPFGLLAAFLAAVIFWQHRKYSSTSRRPAIPGMSGPSAPNQGYPASTYTAVTSETMYGTEATMNPQQYPQYYPQQQQEWKPLPESRPAELLSADRGHERRKDNIQTDYA